MSGFRISKLKIEMIRRKVFINILSTCCRYPTLDLFDVIKTIHLTSVVPLTLISTGVPCYQTEMHDTFHSLKI